jgi:hypothetical protein
MNPLYDRVLMTHEERRNYLMVVCDCEDFYREKETYKSYLESAAAKKFVPAANWKEICERLLKDPAIKELQASKFLPLYEYATGGLSGADAQRLLDEVRQARHKLNTSVQ